MKKKILIITAASLSLICALTGCKGGNNGGKGDVTDLEETQERALYVQQYSDYEARNEWVRKNIEETDCPPVSFVVNGKSSTELAWKKAVGNKTVHTDFAEEAPSKRVTREITYECKEENIKIVLTETSYPGYAVCEYDAKLVNTAKGNSGLISNMLTVNTSIEDSNGSYMLHTNRGSLCAFNDFENLDYKLKTKVSLEVSNGKCTSAYIPYFNLENKKNNTGVISILNWQGNWKAEFEKTETGVNMMGGQYLTNFELQKDETMRFPGLVLLFYKGDSTKGQNVYRRWIYECNLFRYQGKHMNSTNALICPASDTETGDLKEFDVYKRNGVTEVLDKFNKDAGWYDKEGHDWTFTGNWYMTEEMYPNGLKPLSDAAHEEGLEFAVWFEPERIAAGTKTAKDLEGKLMTGSSASDAGLPRGATLLLNYADDSVVEYVVDMLDKIITENGIDQYRQDFNMFPGPYWTAWDEKEADSLDMERTGVTENHYTDGYLKIFSELVKRHPGMYIDACASGGMRYDLETMRYSFLHTRSDYWADIESAQSQTYGSSNWFLYWGTGFSDMSSYDVRSHIGNSIGVGAANDAQAKKLKEALTEWKYLASYLFYDYYPLTLNAGSGKNPMAIQYDSPEDGKGMFITYFRKTGSTVISAKGLDPDAKYIIWDYDDKDETKKVMLGSEIMAGIEINSKARTAVIYEYVLAEGENTDAFRKAEIKTGEGSTDYVEEPDVDLETEGYPEKVDAVYKNGLTDEELKALYDITEDNKIKFAAVDYRSSGIIYEISKNIYDELQTTNGKVSGWKALKKEAAYLYIDSTKNGPFPFTTWDGGNFIQLPLVKEIDGTYFLWLSNIIPFSDSDGGWTDWDVSLYWDTKSGEQKKAKIEGFTVDHAKHERISFAYSDEYNYAGSVYTIDEEIFGSFVYSGKCLTTGGANWYEIDPSKIGICSVNTKAPSETANVKSLTAFFDKLAADEIKAYAAKTETGFELWIMNATHLPVNNRVILVWYNADGTLCQQSFLK